MKRIIYLIISILLYGCWPCDSIIVENGTLPKSALKYVPYLDGNTYKFKHSNGFVISYKTNRKTEKVLERCEHCCKYKYSYEVNTTKLITNYPVFNLEFNIDNFDTLNYSCYATIGQGGFNIPINNDFDRELYQKVDSIKIGSEYYYQVFKMKSNNFGYDSQSSIYVDSLYYNYEKGVIKIILSNNENYTIQE